MISILDSLSGKKKNLPKPAKGAVKLFVCGPTVYDYSHIGHARTYVPFDSFVKYLRSQKIKVFYLQNITDIDDKIINRAKETNTSPLQLSKKFAKEYFSDIKKLEIDGVNKYAYASEHMSEIHKQISALIKKGYAYETENGVYFEVRKFKNYGELSHQNLEELRPGYRIEPDSEKRDVLDFALWKKIKANKKYNNSASSIKNQKTKIENGEITWSSPWGWGRPGWHIEDTAITEKYFGSQYDIHGGASELKFPHHEAEIAQQEAVSGKHPLVKIWLHTGLLLIDGEKMSKSLKNFITIKEFLEKYPAEVLRLMILSNHYRSPFNYKEELAQQTQKSFKTIQEFIWKLKFVIDNKSGKSSIHDQLIKSSIENLSKDFKKSLDDDFNTPKALASIFDFINQIQPQIYSLSKKQCQEIQKNLLPKLAIFGINVKTQTIPKNISKMAATRNLYRESKQFMQADELRNRLEVLGYIIEDTPMGPFIKKETYRNS